MKTALVLGGSGFIGSFLLKELLANPAYGRVIAIFRKPPALRDPKLEILIGDRHALTSLRERFRGDELFIALGTTRKATPDQKEYYGIDHDYPVEAARIAKENGAKAVFLVSSVGADAKSAAFYTRLKGETERDITAVGLARTRIFRPSMLMGDREEHRPMEKTFLKVWSVINPAFAAVGSRFTGIEGADVARAMVASAASPDPEKVKIYEWKELIALLK